jgi:hypothetical protein
MRCISLLVGVLLLCVQHAAATDLSCHIGQYDLTKVGLSLFKNEPVTMDGKNTTFNLNVIVCGPLTTFASLMFYGSDTVVQDWTAGVTASGQAKLTAAISTSNQNDPQQVDLTMLCGPIMKLQFVSCTATNGNASVAAVFTSAAACAATPAPPVAPSAAIALTYYSDYKCGTVQRQPHLPVGCFRTETGYYLRYFAGYGRPGTLTPTGAMVVEDHADKYCSGEPTKTVKYYVDTCYPSVDRTSFQVTGGPVPNITVSECTDYRCATACAAAALSPRCVADAYGGSQLHYCVPRYVDTMAVQLFANNTNCTGAATTTEMFAKNKCYTHRMASFTVTQCAV